MKPEYEEIVRETRDVNALMRELPPEEEKDAGQAFAESQAADVRRRMNRMISRALRLHPERCTWVLRRGTEPMLRQLDKILVRLEGLRDNPPAKESAACRSEVCSDAMGRWLNAVACEAVARNRTGSGLPSRIAVERARADLLAAMTRACGSRGRVKVHCTACEWTGTGAEVLVEGVVSARGALIVCPFCGRWEGLRFEVDASQPAACLVPHPAAREVGKVAEALEAVILDAVHRLRNHGAGEEPRAPWAEVSPAGRVTFTSGGRCAEIKAPDAPPVVDLHSVGLQQASRGVMGCPGAGHDPEAEPSTLIEVG